MSVQRNYFNFDFSKLCKFEHSLCWCSFSQTHWITWKLL